MWVADNICYNLVTKHFHQKARYKASDGGLPFPYSLQSTWLVASVADKYI